MNIVKRDGTQQQFNKEKIEKAVLKAFEAVDGEINEYASQKARNIADYIEKEIAASLKKYDVEDIQDMVESGLMSTKRKDVARAYIKYRDARARKRVWNHKLMRQMADKLEARNVQNQNANVDEYSFGGRKGEADRVIMKQYALDNCMSEMARDNHNNNEIYIHDLDSYAVAMHNCLTVPFDDLLEKGFNTRQTDVRGANSVNTAMQLVAVIFQLQSLCQYGGVAASHLDWTMVPYVRKSFYKHFKDGLKYLRKYDVLKMEYHNGELCDLNDRDIDISTISIEDRSYKSEPEAYEYALDMTVKETEQAVEGLYHNLNTLQSRSGDQLPFSSINYGTCTLPEGRMVIKAFLDGSIKGVGKHHKTPIFPCGIFKLKAGVNRKPGDPNYDLYKLALRSTAQRLYPNYANVDWSGNAGYDESRPDCEFATMGCRTVNGSDIHGLGQQKDGRGNIAPVTIILPTLAMKAKKRGGDIVEQFMQLFDQKLFEARDMLIERFEYICGQDPSAAKFMYENGLMAGYVPEEGIYSALKHGTLTIGGIGIAETLQILIGCDHTEERGMELAKRICQLWKDRCAQFKQEEQLNFGVYFTPN